MNLFRDDNLCRLPEFLTLNGCVLPQSSLQLATGDFPTSTERRRMSDWENDDWETKDVVVPGAATGLTASEALLKNNGYDASKFQDEEEEEDDEPKYVVPQTQPKKERVSKYAHKESMGLQPNVGDVTDKLEQQR